jgi:hypothetical protein
MTWLGLVDAGKRGIDVEPLGSGRVVDMPSLEGLDKRPETSRSVSVPHVPGAPLSYIEKVAIARACSDQANARGLHGFERRQFRAECKKRGGMY